jgi:hypothetical protein
MAQNPTPSLLDSGQILKRLYDESNDAVRLVLADPSAGISVSLSSSEDSVVNLPTSLAATANITSASTGVIIAATSCVGMKTFNLFSKSTSAVVGPQVLTVEISPSDSADVWFATSLTITPSTSNNVVVSGTAASFVARRVRVSTAAALTSGTVSVYLVAQAV